MNFFLQFLMVFFISALGDVFWTLYFVQIEKRNAFMASIWGSIIILIAGITVISYESNHILLLAAVLGGFVGTYLTVKYIKK